MLRKIGTYLGYSVLWVMVFGVIYFAYDRVFHHNAEERIASIDVNVSGGGKYPLLDNDYMRDWILQETLSPINRIINDVNIAEIESVANSHSATKSANAYITYDGELKLDVVQRDPIARLRLNGYDAYITADGYVIPAKECFSVPVIVVTGRYRPLFDKGFSGYADEVVNDSIAALNSKIEELEQSKLPHYQAMEDNRAELRKALRRKVERGLFISKESDSILRAELKRYKSEARNHYRYVERELEKKIADINEEQNSIRHKQDLLRHRAADFQAMIEFLAYVDANSYWSSEIVQVVAMDDRSGGIQLSIVPRSGRFIVDLGTTEELKQKLANLQRFYRNGLNSIGWERYQTISLRYRGQVVCR